MRNAYWKLLHVQSKLLVVSLFILFLTSLLFFRHSVAPCSILPTTSRTSSFHNVTSFRSFPLLFPPSHSLSFARSICSHRQRLLCASFPPLKSWLLPLHLLYSFPPLTPCLTVQHIANDFSVHVYETHSRIALESDDMNEYNQCQTMLKQLYGTGQRGCELEFLAYRVLYYVYLLGWC
jgi:hypothetical protein